jgi:hypothetical protein
VRYRVISNEPVYYREDSKVFEILTIFRQELSAITGAVIDNHRLYENKCEIGYTLPKSISSKFMCKKLQLSVFGRNLFYIYKAMPDYDVESSVGTNWTNQAQIGGSTAPMRSFGISLRASF